MPSTPAERKALLFLSALLCLGVGVRAASAVRREPAPAESRAALARQIEAVDSARRSERGRRGAGRDSAARGKRRPRRSPDGASSPATRPPPPAVPVDVDTASAATLERLPRIGPALARRIVEERERNGPFGSLEGFQRVRGVGPALARALGERVTFSGSPRPTRAVFTPLRGPR